MRLGADIIASQVKFSGHLSNSNSQGTLSNILRITNCRRKLAQFGSCPQLRNADLQSAVSVFFCARSLGTNVFARMMQLLDCDLMDYSESSRSPNALLEGLESTSATALVDSEARRRIFVVDDYPDLAEAAKFVLEDAGFEVSAFCEREVALRTFVEASPRPVLLITDYLGGTMSGLGLIKICKAISPRLKALLVSGIDYRALSRKELLLLDGALGKPYSTAELLEQVQRVLGAGRFTRPSLASRLDS
jgi:CheY-like chemotaxis protein